MFGAIVQAILALVAVFISVVYLVSRYRYGYWMTLGVPYEEPTIFIGNLTFLMRKSFWEFMYDMGKKYRRNYYGIFMGWKPALVIQSPELCKKVLVKDYEHFQDRYLYSGYEADPLGTLNLFNVKSPMWNQLRNELAPMFTSMRLKKLTELMNINSEQLVHKIQKDYVENKLPVDMKELFSMYTSDTVGYTVFGLRVSALNDPSSPLWFITRHMVKWTFWRGFEFSLIFFLPYIAKFLRLKFFSQPATDYVKQIFWEVVQERKKTGKSSERDLVNHLLQLKENLKLPVDTDSKMADDLMVAQAALFILGAIETSSTTLSYCLHELAHHPKEQEKLYEEINSALQTTGKDILEFNDLMELNYLSGCINETLRKYPPVPYIDRMCNKSYQLDDSLKVEAGVPVFVNVVALHYDERHYPQSQLWRPERFTALSDNDNRNYTFLPFGDGPRFCIGKRYGMLQIKTAIAQMVTKYRFEPYEDEPYEVMADPYSVILAPKSGGKIKFIPR